MAPRSEKAHWAAMLPNGKPAKDSLARVIEIDHDEAEESYYEAAADPTYVTLERQQRRYRAMLRRRLRHLAGRPARLSRELTARKQRYREREGL